MSIVSWSALVCCVRKEKVKYGKCNCASVSRTLMVHVLLPNWITQFWPTFFHHEIYNTIEFSLLTDRDTTIFKIKTSSSLILSLSNTLLNFLHDCSWTKLNSAKTLLSQTIEFFLPQSPYFKTCFFKYFSTTLLPNFELSSTLLYWLDTSFSFCLFLAHCLFLSFSKVVFYYYLLAQLLFLPVLSTTYALCLAIFLNNIHFVLCCLFPFVV